MKELFNSFIAYFNEAKFDELSFWAFPIGTLLFIWLATTVSMKIFNRRKRLKAVYTANRTWITCSLIAAFIIISLICIWWSRGFFNQHPWQFTLLISLFIAMIIPLFILLNIRSFYTIDGIKEITDQPKTGNQLDFTITFLKRVFRRMKLYYLIPIIGFLFLFLYFFKGTNLITIVFDNSGSMEQTTAIDALSDSFTALDKNNEIILTTIEGYQESDVSSNMYKKSLNEIMKVKKSTDLKAGNIVAFTDPIDARNGLAQISNEVVASPICESVWKTFLYIKETKVNQTYANKLLIVVSDGDDNFLGDTLLADKFFFDDDQFANYFPPENVFIIDYSYGNATPLIQRFDNVGCDIYPAENNKQDYLDALDNALQSFKNNWFLIYWTILIFSLLTIIGLIIQPKKIV